MAILEGEALEAQMPHVRRVQDRLGGEGERHRVRRTRRALRRVEVEQLLRAVKPPLAGRVQFLQQVERIEAALLASPRAAHDAIGDARGEADDVVRAVLGAVARGPHGVVVPVVRPVAVQPHARVEVPARRTRVVVDERAGRAGIATTGIPLHEAAPVDHLRERGEAGVRPPRKRTRAAANEEERGRGRATEGLRQRGDLRRAISVKAPPEELFMRTASLEDQPL